MVRVSVAVAAAGWLGLVNAHLAAWHKGMYCLNGPQDQEDLNSYAIVSPLYEMEQSDWFFHHINRCDEYPPADGDFLEIPAGGSFTVEIASNRAKTTLSYDGKYTSDWPDGGNYPDDYNVPSCITSPNMHTQNESMAAGTAFAISYQSDIKQVTPENLVVFSIKYHTPWKRVTTYEVPAAMPPCPEDGCICAWGWVPDGCGQNNMYHHPFKCKVTGSTSNVPLADPKPPVWCENNSDDCVKGAKQMISWNQNSGQNVFVDGFDFEGEHKSPAYNAKCGFADGAQNDIFQGSDSSSSSGSSSGSSSSSSPSSSSSSAPSSSDNSGNDSSNSSNNNPDTGNGFVAVTTPLSSSTPESTPESTPDSTPEAESTPEPSSTQAEPSVSASSSTFASAAATSSSAPSRQCRRKTAAREAALARKRAIAHVKVHHNHHQQRQSGGRWTNKARLAGDS